MTDAQPDPYLAGWARDLRDGDSATSEPQTMVTTPLRYCRVCEVGWHVDQSGEHCWLCGQPGRAGVVPFGALPFTGSTWLLPRR